MTLTMTSISAVTLEVTDPVAAAAFHSALGLDDRIQVRQSDASTTGFRGFSLSLLVAQPANVDLLFAAATAAGATVLKPVKKSLWGYGGIVQAPDGTVWKFATSSKKDSAPASMDYDELVLLIGAADVKASKRFYVDQGMGVDKSFGSKYVQFDAAPGDVKLALYGSAGAGEGRRPRRRRQRLAPHRDREPGGGLHRPGRLPLGSRRIGVAVNRPRPRPRCTSATQGCRGPRRSRSAS